MLVRFNSHSTLGIITAVVLICFILVAFIAVSVLTNPENSNITSDDQIEQLLDETLNEITNYIQIKDKIGKYYEVNNELRIKKIALLITPFFSKEISLFDMKIEICNGEKLKILNCSRNTARIEQEFLFDHPIWDNISNNTFGFIVINDRDKSIEKHGCFNDQTDVTYLIIKLSDEFFMKNGDEIHLKLLPPSGTLKQITLKAPLPINKIITF